MTEIKVSFDAEGQRRDTADRIGEYLDNLADNLDAELIHTVLLGAVHIEGEIQEAVNDTSRGGHGGLQRSYNAVAVVKKGNVYESGAYSHLSYARIQDEGGDINAKHVKNLAIPLSAEAKTPGKWPRTWAKGRLQFIKSKSGKKFLIETKGKGDFTLHYMLKPRVTLPAKNYLDQAVTNSEPGLRKILGDGIKEAVRKA